MEKEAAIMEKGEKKVEVEGPTLLSIGPDPLLVIFQFLPLKDRMRLERVCKKFKKVSRSSWKNVQKLDISYFFEWKKEGTDYEIYIMVPKERLASVWLRSSPFVRSLLFSRFTYSAAETRDILDVLLSKASPKLTQLHLGALKFDAENLHSLCYLLEGPLGQQLRILDFDEVLSRVPLVRDAEMLQAEIPDLAEVVTKIIKACPNLEEFRLTASCGIPAVLFLNALPSSIQKIVLENYTVPEKNQFNNVPKPKLRELSLVRSPFFSTYIPFPLTSLIIGSRLEVLDVSGGPEIPDLAVLAQFRLRKLYLNNYFVPWREWSQDAKELFRSFSQESSILKDTITVLHMKNCRLLDADTLVSIAKFSRLEELSLEGRRTETGPQVLDVVFRNCPNLQSLSVRDSDKFNDDCLQSLGVNCQKLSYLDISCCVNPTDEGVVMLVTGLALTEEQQNEAPYLTIYCYRTRNLQNSNFGGHVRIISDNVVPPKRYKYASERIRSHHIVDTVYCDDN